MNGSFWPWVIVAGIVLLAMVVAKSFAKRRAPPPAKPRRAEIPVTISIELGSASSRSSETAPRTDAKWYGPGKAITVAGHAIADGMVYVGRFLAADPNGEAWAAREPDPSLINPDLPISAAAPDLVGSTMTYWPSYAAIQPAARAAYLRWLSTGKSDPQAYIGYVFLYFYGLERRLFVDRASPDEAGRLVAEVERLRAIYAGNGSFDRYSRALLDAVFMLGLAGGRLDPDSAQPDLLARDTKLSLPLKIRIGRMIKEGRPLPFDLALAGYMSASRMPMPADRCRAEFVALMRARLAAKYPDGFKMRPRHGPLQTWYRGASRHIAFDLLQGKAAGALPDPDLMNWERLDAIVAETCEALGPYSRFIGRKPEKAGSLEAKALLPPEIKGDAVSSAGGDLRAWLDREAHPLATIPLKDLAGRVLGAADGKLGTRTLRAIADILDEFGYGVEPDPRFTALRADGDDVALVFKAPSPAELANEPREAYRLASAIVTLVAGVGIASSDGLGAHELRWIDWIDKRLGLTPTECARLRAHLYWLVAKKISLGQIKKMLAAVPAGERESVARFAASVAVADGVVDKAEVAFLEKICDELGVDRAVLYSALHETAAVTASESDPPRPEGFKIPKPKAAAKPTIAAKRGGDGALDRGRIAQVMAETHKVSTILASVFVDEAAPAPQGTPATAGPSAEQAFEGLDAAHGRLLTKLLVRENWTRTDFDAAARSEGLMPDGALETINEWSYDVADDALIEDDGDLRVNQTLGRELAA